MRVASFIVAAAALGAAGLLCVTGTQPMWGNKLMQFTPFRIQNVIEDAGSSWNSFDKLCDGLANRVRIIQAAVLIALLFCSLAFAAAVFGFCKPQTVGRLHGIVLLIGSLVALSAWALMFDTYRVEICGLLPSFADSGNKLMVGFVLAVGACVTALVGAIAGIYFASRGAGPGSYHPI